MGSKEFNKLGYHVGQQMQDGTIFAGVSHDCCGLWIGKMPAGLYQSSDVDRMIDLLNQEGPYNDWRLPYGVEAMTLFMNREAGALKDIFEVRVTNPSFWATGLDGQSVGRENFETGIFYQQFDNEDTAYIIPVRSKPLVARIK